MIQHQFNTSFSQERRIVYALVALIIAIGVLAFSETSLSVITLILALIAVAYTVLVILFLV
jgi:amino acid permease